MLTCRFAVMRGKTIWTSMWKEVAKLLISSSPLARICVQRQGHTSVRQYACLTPPRLYDATSRASRDATPSVGLCCRQILRKE